MSVEGCIFAAKSKWNCHGPTENRARTAALRQQPIHEQGGCVLLKMRHSLHPRPLRRHQTLRRRGVEST